jgi:predicted double-glycine peptidase
MQGESPRRRQVLRAAALAAIAGVSAMPFLLAFAGRWVGRDEQRVARWRAWRRGAIYLGNQGVVLQKRNNDCAAAALLMVLRAHGLNPPEATVYDSLRIGSNGVSMASLQEAAGKLGVPAEGWRLDYRRLTQSPLPAILLFDNDHFVVLNRISSESSVEVIDPALGRLLYSRRSLESHWTGYALLF